MMTFLADAPENFKFSIYVDPTLPIKKIIPERGVVRVK